MRTAWPRSADEYLAVADLAGARRFDNGFDDPLDLLVIHRQFELHLGQKIDDVLRPPIKLSVALLPAKAFDLCHGNALNPHLGQRGAHIVKLEGFDDGDDHFHAGRLQVRVNMQSSSGIAKRIAALQHGVLQFL